MIYPTLKDVDRFAYFNFALCTNKPNGILGSIQVDFGDIKKAEANPDVLVLLKKPLIPNELEAVLKKYFK